MLLYSDGDWTQALCDASPDQRGPDVVYDSVDSTLLQSLAVVRTGGPWCFSGWPVTTCQVWPHIF